MYIVYFGCLFILFTVQSSIAQDADCPTRDKADLVFVLDSSGSIRDNNPDDGSYDNYDLLLQFVIAIVNELDIGADATQVGVVTFSNFAQSVIYLDQYHEKLALIDAIRLDIGYIGGDTNTSGGIRVMHEEQFNAVNGDRADVENIAIVITDGVSTIDRYRTIQDAESAHRAGIQMFSIGITDRIDVVELRDISSPPRRRDENYFTSTDFTILGDLVDSILTQTCSFNEGLDDNSKPDIDFCLDEKTDVVFVIDSSGSIRDRNPSDGSYDNWQLVLNFIIEIVDTFKVGKNKIRVGLVRYSNFVDNQFFLDTYETRFEIKEAIRNMEYIGSETNTSGALYEMRKEQFTKGHGDRKNVPNVAIVITDGVSTQPEQTLIEANEARRDDVTMYAIGITDQINEEEVANISSKPQKKNKNYFLSTDFDTLNNMKIKIKCKDEDNNNGLLYGMLALVAVVVLGLMRLSCLFCTQMAKKYEEDEEPLTPKIDKNNERV